MAKEQRMGQRRTSRSTLPPQSRLKIFKPITWYDGIASKSVGEYISHILLEVGRLGLSVDDIERRDRPPNTKMVLSDILDWLSDPPESLLKMADWRAIDLDNMSARIRTNRNAKPRIEVTAHITKMNNLSVRWYPGGWADSEINWDNKNWGVNLISRRVWRERPDFSWFQGDEEPTFDSRPSNELMYLRGVGNLSPEPRESYGPYATYNSDIVDSILISAVRAAYESLIDRLKSAFEVHAINGFDFAIREEIDETEEKHFRYPIRRVTGWTLENSVELMDRRKKKEAAEKENRERAELDSVYRNFGITLDDFVAVLDRVCLTAAPMSSAEAINRNVAKTLSVAGRKVTATHVRRIRELVERYRSDILPQSLKPEPTLDKNSGDKAV